jgi:hypothetical protein
MNKPKRASRHQSMRASSEVEDAFVSDNDALGAEGDVLDADVPDGVALDATFALGACTLEALVLSALDELLLDACALAGLSLAELALALGAAGSVDRHAAHAINAQLASRTTRDEVSMELELERTLSPCR